jgi:hypothetical protein
MALACNAENFRAELGRHRLDRASVCSLIGMHENLFSMYINGIRPMPDWAAHNLGWGFNTATGLMLFGVDMELGPVSAPKGRPGGRTGARPTVRLPARRRRKRWVFQSY